MKDINVALHLTCLAKELIGEYNKKLLLSVNPWHAVTFVYQNTSDTHQVCW